MRVEALRRRGGDASAIASLEKELQGYENSVIWQNWMKIENAFAQVGSRAPFPEPVHMEVRERDYFYTPAFIFMSMMFGIGAGILVLMAATSSMAFLATPVAILLVASSFAVPCFSNYQEHDRSGSWYCLCC